jgi:hypothetical protein
MRVPWNEGAGSRRSRVGAGLGALAVGLGVMLAMGLPTTAQETPPPPPPDDVSAAVAACMGAGIAFDECVDATIAGIVPIYEAAVPAATPGAETEAAPPPLPPLDLPPLPLPLPPVLGGGDVPADEVEDEEEAVDEGA